jgi:hypothetical protein
MEALTDYQCPVCKLTYTYEHLRQQCEAWCRTHESCNLQIASQSLEAQKMRIPRSTIEHQSQEQPQQ